MQRGVQATSLLTSCQEDLSSEAWPTDLKRIEGCPSSTAPGWIGSHAKWLGRDGVLAQGAKLQLENTVGLHCLNGIAAGSNSPFQDPFSGLQGDT